MTCYSDFETLILSMQDLIKVVSDNARNSNFESPEDLHTWLTNMTSIARTLVDDYKNLKEKYGIKDG